MTLANQLTLLRVALIPVFVLVFYLPYKWSYFASAIIFSAAAITDWLDGYLARKMNQSTPFGAFLDPVADKLMVATALVLLVGLHKNGWFTVAAAVIIGREIAVSGLREWMAELGKRSSVAVSFVGKIKTTAQMAAIIILLAFDVRDYPLMEALGYILLYIAAALTLWTMIMYLRAAWPALVGDDNDEAPEETKGDS
ncbi:CDP-diacylglycerol--glycerol-3-phosphate 3-phosphatidyltransferase [Microbulbifer flavimaris]|uniref:CDP-diacylglycerol--glycerol-3-phosphate 3-phosphatidyltransferase n=1 Tax=Microbulbifer flavimaris TaxID=1781068 RepID=A0ABX4I4V5_9GAMM|nr:MULTISPECIES: CDP-diacylglycerol--glycerol-3-phosphate 3-phosphatidyltransferase [Microbulbifer]KUJ84828.1 CDP-diacylglycerol--glycerol-3-phosphate 3-phosphatidyltransferase [Microbulbifer sp. ZGT114]PCO06925.1 CDP-diacylglycerol--glycerol-3-phosphate 3-phosphatidyltransferase [Microbulbifer flavimaris]